MDKLFAIIGIGVMVIEGAELLPHASREVLIFAIGMCIVYSVYLLARKSHKKPVAEKVEPEKKVVKSDPVVEADDDDDDNTDRWSEFSAVSTELEKPIAIPRDSETFPPLTYKYVEYKTGRPINKGEPKPPAKVSANSPDGVYVPRGLVNRDRFGLEVYYGMLLDGNKFTLYAKKFDQEPCKGGATREFCDANGGWTPEAACASIISAKEKWKYINVDTELKHVYLPKGTPFQAMNMLVNRLNRRFGEEPSRVDVNF